MSLRDPDGSRLPEPVATFVGAVNARDLTGVVESFADRAVVNDELQEYWNRQAITDWANRQVIGQRLSIEVHHVVRNGDHTVVAAKVDGSFDKRGLPDPLVLTFYFSVRDGKVVQLLILRNEPALSSTP
jgi:ketosteroid isomerase-like protein